MYVLWQSFAKRSQQFESNPKPNKCWKQHVDAVDNVCVVLSVPGELCQDSSIRPCKTLPKNSARNHLFLFHTVSSVLGKECRGQLVLRDRQRCRTGTTERQQEQIRHIQQTDNRWVRNHKLQTDEDTGREVQKSNLS